MRGHLVVPVVLSSLLLAGLSSPVSAAPQEGDIVAEGHIIVGLHLADSLGRFLVGEQGAVPAQDLHSFRFDAADLAGVWLAATAPAEDPDLQLLALEFEDATGATLETECTANPGQHALLDEPYGEASFEPLCLVPAGAHVGRVSASIGAGIDVVVVVAAPPSSDYEVIA